MNKNWAYITREGKVIECTEKQALSYFKKRNPLTFEEMLDRSGLFKPCPMYKFLQKIKKERS
jgi:hypothetical protein